MTNQEFAQKEARTKKTAGLITGGVFTLLITGWVLVSGDSKAADSNSTPAVKSSLIEENPNTTRNATRSTKSTPTTDTRNNATTKESKPSKAGSKSDAHDNGIDSKTTIRLHSRMINSLAVADK